MTRGVGGFLRPFRRVGGILWLEMSGVFFLLPAVVFAPLLWRAAVAYPHTSDHRTLWVTAFVVAIFLYLGVSLILACASPFQAELVFHRSKEEPSVPHPFRIFIAERVGQPKFAALSIESAQPRFRHHARGASA